jgi:hypothetical protein
MNAREALREEILKSAEALRIAQEAEEYTGEASDSMARRYWEGYTEALEMAVDKLMKEGN